MRILYVTRHFNHSGYLILQSLINSRFDICGVLLHDRKSSNNQPLFRKLFILLYKLKVAFYKCKPLKNLKSEEILAKNNNLNILKFKSIKSKSFYKCLEKVNPDIIVLGGGWHELIPKNVFDYPPLGCINTHPSLLPEFRGTSITRWQVLEGIRKSGSTIHYVNDLFDAGGILAQKEIELNDIHISPQELFYTLGKAGAEMMPVLLNEFKEKRERISSFNVQHDQRYYNYYKAWKWDLKGLSINWEKKFQEIHFFVMANMQESYEYLGPIFLINNKCYFLRLTSYVGKEFFQKEIDSLNIKDDDIYLLALKNSSAFIYRRSEDVILEIKQIQRYNKFFKFNRGSSASKIFRRYLGEKLNLQYEK